MRNKEWVIIAIIFVAASIFFALDSSQKEKLSDEKCVLCGENLPEDDSDWVFFYNDWTHPSCMINSIEKGEVVFSKEHKEFLWSTDVE